MNNTHKTQCFVVALLALATLANTNFFLTANALTHTRSSVNSIAAKISSSRPTSQAIEQIGRIAFVSDRDENFEIYVMDSDGNSQTRLTSNTAEDNSPAWSPDGQRIAFVSNRDGNAEIYVMNNDGTNQTRLTTNTSDDLDPAWSPDGARIAFTSGRDGTDEIYVMNADGSLQTNLSNNRAGEDLQPVWSPQGQHIAFASVRAGNSEIYVMRADGGDQRNLTAAAGDDTDPAWSETRITFQSDRDGNDEIYAMNGADGTAQVRLIANDAPDNAPSRAFNGTGSFAFTSARDGDFEIYAASANGNDERKLTNNDEANDIEPAAQPPAATQALGVVVFSAPTYTEAESTGSATITVTRSGDTTGSATVNFTALSGTASSRTDFNSVLNTLRFAPAETSKTVVIHITNDLFVEGSETINLALSNPAGATLGTPNTATLTITDNDTTQPTTNPIDERDFFIRQQYRDFLHRDPDAPGLAFWAGEYDRRFSDCTRLFDFNEEGRRKCYIRARASISSAFFLSTEFQQTGYLIYRTYDVAFARLGATRPPRNQGITQAAIRLEEFLFDTQAIAQGIIVNNAVDVVRLEDNRQTYFRNFVQRTDFLARFPASLSASEYVDALFTSAGITPTANERLAAVAAYSPGGTDGRATALRAIVSNEQIYQREFNRAFVLLQYFGYLQRNPSDAPEPDLGFAGYNFWLNKMDAASTSEPLNSQNVSNDSVALGRVQRAEMIEAFIISIEYQQRFGAVTTQP